MVSCVLCVPKNVVMTRALSRLILEQLLHEGLDMQTRTIQRVISKQKQHMALGMATPLEKIVEEVVADNDMEDDIEDDINIEDLQGIIDQYNDILKRADALDFTDLLVKGHSLIQKAPFIQMIRNLNHVLVDEL